MDRIRIYMTLLPITTALTVAFLVMSVMREKVEGWVYVLPVVSATLWWGLAKFTKYYQRIGW